MAAMVALVLSAPAPARAADEIHWTFTGPTSVSFDWRGAESSIQYGLTPAYGLSATAYTPSPLPWSSAGPFWEARLTGLLPDTVYHYSIGAGADHTFRTPRAPGRSDFTVMAQGDIGSAVRYWRMGIVQQQVADQNPDFTLMLGDLTYGNAHGQAAVDNHFNDVMVWSQDAAYMPAWGNHEYETGAFVDDFRNYKGRFDFPNPRTSPGAPAAGGPGEDWYWFDYGNVRFIAYPEPFLGAWADWYPKASALMDSAQNDPDIGFIVTFGHRPAFSSAHHPGAPSLKNYLGQLGLAHNKYKLNLNGHSHNYERTFAQNGVIHITAGGGGSHLEDDPSGGCLYLGGCPPPSWSAFRAFRHGPVKLAFSSNEIRVEAICGPPGDTGSNPNDVICTPGSVFDSVTIKIITPESHIDSPVADLEIDAGQAVSFAGTGFDPDGHLPLRYQWDFGGGAPNTTQEDPGPVAFNSIGVYRVSFTVQDSAGYADPTPDVRTISVGAVNHPPDGTIVAPTASLTIEQGESVNFEGSGIDPDGNQPLSYFWNFDEVAPNTNVEDPGPVTFHEIGSFVVQLIVTDGEGLSDPTPAEIEITVIPNQPPNGEIALPLADVTVEIGQGVDFQGTASDPDGHLPLVHAWNFGGGAPAGAIEDPGVVSFSAAGTFVVTYTVTDALGSSDPTPATRTVTVLQPNAMPNGVIDTPATDVTIEPGASVTFAGSGTDADASLPLTYAWSFGGAAPATTVEDPGAITFATPGTYVVTLTVSDARGGADATPATRTVTVRAVNRPPIAVLAMLPATGNAPLSTFADATGSSDPDGPIASHAFDFGDGTIVSASASAMQAHTYGAGNWIAHLTVTDSAGLSHSVTAPLIVAPVTPGFNFALNPSVETDLAGWIPHAGSTIQRATGGFDGPNGIRIVGPDSLVTFGVNDSPNWVTQTSQNHVGLPYRFSAWVRSPSSTGRARLQVREFKNGVKQGSTTFSPFVPLSATWQVVTVDRFIMVAGSTLDFQVFDYPVVPNEVMYVDNIGIHAIGSTTGIEELAGSAEFAVIAAPNPMRSGGTVAFAMPRAGSARIEVLDLSGRRVRSLLDEDEVGAGLHRVVFDGRGADGARLQSGIYFYRVATSAGNVTRRFVILK